MRRSQFQIIDSFSITDRSTTDKTVWKQVFRRASSITGKCPGSVVQLTQVRGPVTTDANACANGETNIGQKVSIINEN